MLKEVDKSRHIRGERQHAGPDAAAALSEATAPVCVFLAQSHPPTWVGPSYVYNRNMPAIALVQNLVFQICALSPMVGITWTTRVKETPTLSRVTVKQA